MSQVRTYTPNFTVVTLTMGAADRGRHWTQRQPTPGGSHMTASLGGRYDPWSVKRSTD